MSWRPEGWKNPYTDATKTYGFENHAPIRVALDTFEAGADAMLEALKKKGAWMTPEQMRVLAPDRKYPYGWIVFIPAEKEKEADTYIYQDATMADILLFIKEYIDNGGRVPAKYWSSPNYIAAQWQPLTHLLDSLRP